jgi:hypothetical protein
MNSSQRIARNQQFLTDLFAGPSRGHAILFSHEQIPPAPGLGDFTLSTRPVKDWLPWVVANYEAQVKLLEALDHDAVPFANVHTNTGIFAAGFGSKIHLFENSNAAAIPWVKTAAEADALAVPDVFSVPTLARIFELARVVRQELGPDVIVNGPDIQSPFDIAALIWNKEEMLLAMLEEPEAVKRLVAKTHALLKNFLTAYRREFPNVNAIHCPYAWAPASLGCSLSEDEVGSISVEMFEEFCLPSLVDLSRTFGGLFMHCCAKADHQYAGFRQIPNFRGLNRVFQHPPGPRPAIEMFSGQTVFMVAWTDEQGVNDLLDMARPDTRFLFNMNPQPLDEARQTLDRLRARCRR